MCGIVGYVGEQEAMSIILDGLARLEYRGYDSAGFAVLSSGEIVVRRSAGKLANLAHIAREHPASGSVGIGHTRWATHGVPNETNAHPHKDCKEEIVIIHNGIVENYAILKKRLLDAGHTFRSQTDSEIIAHLIEEGLQEGVPPQDAMRLALTQLTGAHAIVMLTTREPGCIYAARLGNAGGVVIGQGEGEMFVASDMPAILNHTRRLVFLDSQELAVVNQRGADYYRLDGDPIEKTAQTVSWDPISAAKGGFKHFMLKEIHEQPRSLADTLSGRLGHQPPAIYLDDFDLTDEQLRRHHKVIIVACGTAWHASLVGKFLIEGLARLPVEVDYASEFRYRDSLVDPNTLVVAVTQSGETVDTLVSMERARSVGAGLVGIVNVVGSQATRIADGVIYTRSGPEIGVASTKAFTGQLLALYLLALRLGQVHGTIADEQLAGLIQDVMPVPDQVGRMLRRANGYERLARLYSKCRSFLYLGRGINYPIALEGALKLKEISYIHAEGYPAGEMKHGPIALIDRDVPVVAVAVQDSVYDKMVSNIEQVKARNGVVIAIASEGDTAIEEKADHVIRVPNSSPLLTPILTSIPMQLLAYHFAVERGCDVDQPRNLAKSVTVE